MNTRTFRAFLAMGALATAAASWGCVADRPSRNGVFNENQYVRKSFIVRAADGSSQDTGWIMKSTIVSTSTPNPLGGLYLGAGMESGGALVRFVVQQDKLQIVNMREIGPSDPVQANRIPEVVNAWPITNVDLKYRINLDGEKTNFYEENQELDWQVRQWVKINFAKNDMSDLAAFGSYAQYYLDTCTDLSNASAVLLPNSFTVDEKNNYMQWSVQLTLPIKFDDTGCTSAYGEAGQDFQRLGRNSVTMNVMYSFMRAKPLDPNDPNAYVPFELAEKDPIQHKYGPLRFGTYSRDPDTGLLTARSLVLRFNPNKDNVWYFAKGYPEDYKPMFLGKGGIVDQTNELLDAAHAKGHLVVKNFDQDLPDGECDLPDTARDKQCPREYGDVRYSFVRWFWDPDGNGGAGWAGVTQFVPDPRTGEALSSSINIAGFPIKDYYVQTLDAYLKSVGASEDINSASDWSKGSKNCKEGDVMPIVDSVVKKDHNLNSTLYTKMQLSLQKPVATFGNLGPVDFIQPHDPTDDFWKAYYAIIPYQVFADPAVNQYVTPEGFGGVYGGPSGMLERYRKEYQFQQMAAQIDRGENPFDDVTGPTGLKNATDFMNTMRSLTVNHRELEYTKPFTHPNMMLDTTDLVSVQSVIQRDARHCVLNDPADPSAGTHWETKDEWVNNLVHTYWTQVVWHEFGHSLGLEHNFMASVDKPNYPHYTDSSGRDHVSIYASSVMEYNASPDRVFWKEGWAPYDKGAIAFIYGNAQDKDHAAPAALPNGVSSTTLGISGQATATAPWNDPKGFDVDPSGKATERQFLFCNEAHMKYTPLCRQGDLGATPSEIIANQIDSYEWHYQWRNFRLYRKFWDDSPYANAPAALITDMRKFMSLWVFDWNSDELSDTFRRIGIVNPNPNGSQLQYYNALENKFNQELSAANSMVAAFHNAVIQQSSGERPYRSIYDKYYGDVTQQGIILDKFFAMQGFTALWPTDNYDVNQAGSYLASYEGLGDSFYNFVAEQTVDTMIGGQYDVFPWFVPSAVAQFAQDTHSPSFGGRRDVRDWIGGHVFYRLQDFLDYFRDLAVQNNAGCTDIATCKYDPRVAGVSDYHNEFLGPDKRLWAWAYIADRNTWLAVQKERNTATYIIVRDYNNDVVNSQDDGAHPGAAYGLQLPMKYTLDAFNQYN